MSLIIQGNSIAILHFNIDAFSVIEETQFLYVLNVPKLQLSNLSSVKLWTRFEFRKKLSKAKNFTWFRGFNFWTQKWTKLE